MSLGLALRLVAAILLLQSAPAKDVRPFPEPDVFFEAVRANLARSQDDQRLFAYKVGSSRVDLQACKLEYSIVSPK